MKFEFWKEGLGAIILCSMAPLLCIMLAVIVAVKTFGSDDFIQIMTFWIIPLLFSVIPFYRLFQKVIITDVGIELKFGKKQIAYIEWFEITDFEVTLQYPGARRFKFTSGDKVIDIFVSSQELYNTVMDICPNLNVTMMIKDSPYLTLLYKRWLKKQENDKEKHTED